MSWYYSNTKCCPRCFGMNGPISVDILHSLWLKNEIQDLTKVYSHVTSHPTEINKIWQRDTNTNTVEMRQDAFNVDDEVQFKSWLSSPSPYNDWSYISKNQKGIVSGVDELILVQFETCSSYYCQPHELMNITTKKKNATGIKKCCYTIKSPISFIGDLQTKFKNHVIGLLFTLFTESYDIITDVLFTLLLYNRDEMDLFMISVASLCVPSVLSYCVSLILLCQAFDPEPFRSSHAKQAYRWSGLCIFFIGCSCCCCGLFPFLVLISTVIKLLYCIYNQTWYFTENNEEAYGDYPCVMFHVIMTFFIRGFEDLPQIIINFIFVYDRNNGKIELINLLSIIGSIFVIIKTLLFGWKEFVNMRSYAKGMNHLDSQKGTSVMIRSEKMKTKFGQNRRKALGITNMNEIEALEL
eukprot:539936_1